MFKEVVTLIVSLIGIVLIMVFTYYSTKLIANKTNFNKSKYMNIVDKLIVGQNKYLLIVEINEKHYLIGATDNEINMLKEIDGLKINTSCDIQESTKFNQILSKLVNKD